jgi:hypothetical protein
MCWLKSSLFGLESQADRVSGYYDPCRDPRNFEQDIEYQGEMLPSDGKKVGSSAECCRKCVATNNCKYWTLGTAGTQLDVCSLRSAYTVKVKRPGSRVSGAFDVTTA